MLTLCLCFFVLGFTSVISGSETDRYLSRCALERNLRARDLIEALERINRFDASAIVGRWLANVNRVQQITTMYTTRGESSASERSCSLTSRRRWTSGASEHSEVRPRSTGGSSASEGSPQLRTELNVNNGRRPCSCACLRHSFDSSDRKESSASQHSLPFDAERVQSRSGSTSSKGSFTGGHWRHGVRSASSASIHSFPTEESFCETLERLSCEESQTYSTEQIVPEPRLISHPCTNCQYCAPKLPLQDHGGTEPRLSIEETSKHTSTSAQNRDSDLFPSPVQVSDCVSKEEVTDEESLPTTETGEPGDVSYSPISRLIPELSSRLSVSWRPVAVDLGLRGFEIGRFEDSSLLRVQASGMLHFWLSNNKCTLECEHCQEVILQRLAEACENAHRADLKDFLQHTTVE